MRRAGRGRSDRAGGKLNPRGAPLARVSNTRQGCRLQWETWARADQEQPRQGCHSCSLRFPRPARVSSVPSGSRPRCDFIPHFCFWLVLIAAPTDLRPAIPYRSTATSSAPGSYTRYSAASPHLPQLHPPQPVDWGNRHHTGALRLTTHFDRRDTAIIHPRTTISAISHPSSLEIPQPHCITTFARNPPKTNTQHQAATAARHSCQPHLSHRPDTRLLKGQPAGSHQEEVTARFPPDWRRSMA